MEDFFFSQRCTASYVAFRLDGRNGVLDVAIAEGEEGSFDRGLRPEAFIVLDRSGSKGSVVVLTPGVAIAGRDQ